MSSFSEDLKAFFFDIFETVAISVVIFLVIYAFLVQPHQVLGNSMFPTLHSEENILTDKISPRFSGYKRGDIVVFKAPPQRGKDYIKRIVGLPGEMVKLSSGRVFGNDQQLIETYLPSGTETQGRNFMKDNQETLVPLGTYFVLGDNRMYSSDSREWGMVPTSDVIGKAWFRYWPVTRFSLL